ncbi:hypothetical protein T310_0691 [Rasamsonia emersonii CBS 393.64]|uniref:Uncharacterized protein n=1 Tax=Rasamsonia emersonii (strain ATCC 16479 / CBS 393.64 / IMI 116815) TaxID=1408163 RepID=A0A0F4Z5Z1_RASE3|nr:hypothetical protein T310_0691 [Rasamsonia emersonii CBS 393.64]KKA25283.1 hypothetical protein T310_0691 [Rasamsonia emersonii CBS 393.64]
MSLQQSITAQLGSVAYFVRSRVEEPFHSDFSRQFGERETVTPAVVLHAENPKVSVDFLENSFSRFAVEDDVFSTEFLINNILIRSSTLLFVDKSEGKDVLPQGPYFASRQGLHQVWRLYEDSLAAFVSSVIPSDDPYLFEPLKAAAYTGLHRVVAVPSRLYYPKTDKRPLNGMRIAIKDNMHLNGIVTTLGSRSYTACYGVQKVTSSFVKQLIDQGAIIVRKTKLSAYAGAEIPPEKCIDYFPPWNARTDGYQGPSGSSSGEDRRIQLAGLEPCNRYYRKHENASSFSRSLGTPGHLECLAHGGNGAQCSDTFGILGRSADEIRQALLSSGLHAPTGLEACSPLPLEKCQTAELILFVQKQLPKKILYPTDWFPYPNPKQQQMTEEFIGILEEFLGISHTKISLKEKWTRSAPEDLRATPLTDYLNNTVEYVNLHDGFHSFDNFREEHRNLFGHDMLARITVDDEQRAQADKETEVFKNWIDAHILTRDASGASEAIMILPLGRPGPNYRDIVPPQNTGPAWYGGYDEDFFASMLGLPQLVIPIGQNPYESRISGRTEYFPIVGSIAPGEQTKTEWRGLKKQYELTTSHLGSDLMLLQIAPTRLLNRVRDTLGLIRFAAEMNQDCQDIMKIHKSNSDRPTMRSSRDNEIISNQSHEIHATAGPYYTKSCTNRESLAREESLSKST